MPEERESILEFFAAEAIRLGAIGSLPWSTALRKELSANTRRKRVIVVDGANVELRAKSFDSFGGLAYRVELRRVTPKMKS